MGDKCYRDFFWMNSILILPILHNPIVSAQLNLYFRSCRTSSFGISSRRLWKCRKALYAIVAPRSYKYWGAASSIFDSFPMQKIWQVSTAFSRYFMKISITTIIIESLIDLWYEHAFISILDQPILVPWRSNKTRY